MTENRPSPETGGNGLLVAGIILLLLAGGAGYLTFAPGQTPDEAEVTAAVEPLETNEISTTVAESNVPSPSDGVAEAAPDAEPTQNSDQPAEQATPEVAEAEVPTEAEAQQSPSIDEVRVDSSGLVVVAGRGAPGSTVDVVVDGEVVTSAEVDTSGAFAALGTVEADESARTLTLQSGAGDATVASEEEIIIAPIKPAEAVAETDQVAAAPAASASDRPQTSVDGAEPETIEAARAETGNVNATEEVTVILPSAGSADVASSADAIETTDQEGEAASEPPVKTAALPPENQRELAADPETIASSEAQAVTPSEATETAQVTASETSVSAEAAPSTPAETTTAATETQSQPSVPAEQADRVAVLRSDADGVTLLQAEPVPAAQVVLDTIGYNDDGVVQLSGRAGAEAAEVRIYLDNRSVARFATGENGAWRGAVPGVAPGVYTLRVDAMTAEGRVASRLETPFKREAPAALAAATERSAEDGPVLAVTVQAGDTLWAIARDRYGEGVLYVQVFEANRDAIRDPDLIYPGQVFDLPQD